MASSMKNLVFNSIAPWRRNGMSEARRHHGLSVWLFRTLHSGIPSESRARHDTGITIANSLTKRREALTTSHPGLLFWYQCGPTVYDSAHLGHASSYVHFDIIRRIMESHFGIEVVLAQGVTDIDDKIIARAAQRGIDFRDLSRQYEQEFNEDMDRLGVLPPTMLTRVSENIPTISNFIKVIMDKGLSYEAEGSVYFDTSAFGARYGKLHALEEASVSTEPFGENKKNRSDFALWKTQKETSEPAWPSVWGKGRPGWHIECSAMIERVLGPLIDLHTGGRDLLFPHHNNEIAQSEAYHGCDTWCPAFMHSGLIHVRGEKMSKSLGNMSTVRQMLETHSARRFRLFCLLSRYDHDIFLTDSSFDEARAVEHRMTEACASVQDLLTESSPQGLSRWGDEEKELHVALRKTKVEVDAALRNNFSTPVAVQALMELLSRMNGYIAARQLPAKNTPLVSNVYGYIAGFLRTLGAEFPLLPRPWTAVKQASPRTAASPNTTSASSSEAMIKLLLDFRAQVRNEAMAMGRDQKLSKDALLKACDYVRKNLAGQKPPVHVRDKLDGSYIITTSSS